MSFKISYSYPVRDKSAGEYHVSPTGTIKEFTERLAKVLELHKDRPGFKLTAKFG